MGDLVQLVAEKEELLKIKHKELEQMQDKILRTYAEMENVLGRTKREAENSKKFAIQVCLQFSAICCEYRFAFIYLFFLIAVYAYVFHIVCNTELCEESTGCC